MPLMFALNKARTRRNNLKAISAIMVFQCNQMEVPVFRLISSSASSDTLLPFLMALSRDSPTGDLNPHQSSINLRILYDFEKRFKKMFRLSRNVFECILEALSPFLNEGMSRNHQQNVSASSK
jgi:hypothetical protein